MKKLFIRIYNVFLITVLLLGYISIQSSAETTISKGDFIIDFYNNDSFPNNFRKTSDNLKIYGNLPSLKGLSKINASGSSEFTSNSLDIIKESIGKDFIVADLRQESHGYINGSAISWRGLKNNLNKGLTLEEVNMVENKLLSSIPLKKSIIPENSPGPIVPQKVYTEEELVKSKNLKYVRFPVTDGERPTDDVIDSFVSFASSLDDESWIHFHCDKGIGRTTTFLSMYDMMKNSKEVSFDDIIFRQFLLSNENLVKDQPDGSYSNRAEMLMNFYNYTKENTDNFKTSWSQWIEKNNIAPYMGCNCID